MDQPDPVVHQPMRLKIMAALHALPEREKVEFVRLRAATAATDGALGSHIVSLEASGYVAVEKDFHAKKPRTRVTLTRAGRRAFVDYLNFLQDFLQQTKKSP